MERSFDVSLVRVMSNENNFDGRPIVSNLLGEREAPHFGHRNIQENDLRNEPLQASQERLAIFKRREHFVLSGNEVLNAFTDPEVIVGHYQSHLSRTKSAQTNQPAVYSDRTRTRGKLSPWDRYVTFLCAEGRENLAGLGGFRMKILQVAYPLFAVSEDSAGGAEQILFLLERGLVAHGHQSIVIGAEGSRVSGSLIETPAAGGEVTDAIRRDAQRVHLKCIELAIDQFRPDLTHFHGLDFNSYVPAAGIPTVATLHLPVSWYPQSIFDIDGVEFCCVSDSQAHTAPERARVAIVPNGIDVSLYRADLPHSEYLLWLGRVCEEKGTDVALRVAHRLDEPLTIAGPVHPFAYHRAYFTERVEPLLDEERRYVGAVGIEQKAQMLAQARCVLIPSLAAETGSLVAMEAIASGTPVIAFRSGALPEIVEDGVTGFIVDSEEEMADAVSRIGEISSQRCRTEAVRRFSAERMVEDYIRLYERLLASA